MPMTEEAREKGDGSSWKGWNNGNKKHLTYVILLRAYLIPFDICLNKIGLGEPFSFSKQKQKKIAEKQINDLLSQIFVLLPPL